MHALAYLLVETLDHGLGLGGELGDQTSVLDGIVLVHCALHSDALSVDNHDTLERRMSE